MTLAEAWNGSKWSVQKLPKTPGDQGSEFLGVSCTSATACTAVGAYLDSLGRPSEPGRGVERHLLVHRDHPQPLGRASKQPHGCVMHLFEQVHRRWRFRGQFGHRHHFGREAQRHIVVDRDHAQPFWFEGSVLDERVLHLDQRLYRRGRLRRQLWHRVTPWPRRGTAARGPSRPLPTPPVRQRASSTACPAPRPAACSAVGDYVNSSGDEEALAEEWNGSSWSVEAVPNPSGARGKRPRRSGVHLGRTLHCGGRVHRQLGPGNDSGRGVERQLVVRRDHAQPLRC